MKPPQQTDQVPGARPDPKYAALVALFETYVTKVEMLATICPGLGREQLVDEMLKGLRQKAEGRQKAVDNPWTPPGFVTIYRAEARAICDALAAWERPEPAAPTVDQILAAGASAEALPPPMPASVVASPKTTAAGAGIGVSDKLLRRTPGILPDPGLTAVTDSMLPPLVGHTATSVWLCLLRHANGRPGRLVKGIGYHEIGEGTGLTRQQIRDGLAVLLNVGIVQRTQEGRTRHGTKLTAEYVVHFPTSPRLERWLIAATDATKESA